MTKYKASYTTYKVHGEKTGIDYLVTMKRIKNTPSGNPRFEATVTPLVPFGFEPNGIEYLSHDYIFHGHYYDERIEAQFLIDRITRTQEV